MPTTFAPARHGAPADYDELRRYLRDARQRQRALGVAENTIAAWDRHQASRIRREHTSKVAVLVWTCRSIARFFDREQDVGAFLLSPQLALGNRAPVGLVRLYGERGAGVVVQVATRSSAIAAEVDSTMKTDPVFENEAVWDAIRAGLSDAALSRIDAGVEAARRLREIQGTSALVD